VTKEFESEEYDEDEDNFEEYEDDGSRRSDISGSPDVGSPDAASPDVF